MSALSFVLVNEATPASPLASQVKPEWLAMVAGATTVQLDRDVSPAWGGTYSVRAGKAGELTAADEIVFAILDSLPDAPGAIAYHDVDGNAAPTAFLALSTCHTLDDVSIAISHELCETAGDEGCNSWSDAGDYEYATELCDAVESFSYMINGIAVSDFLLRSFFKPHAYAPYSYGQAMGGPGPGAPFQTAGGGYQIRRADGGPETQVNGVRAIHRVTHARHWSSRTSRRGVK